ncbi:MAG: DUF4169 family protein [Alphaproteobacteria bacterium]|nr:DUF4169 family protein [Rhodospirillales bacterium]MCW9045720.1 DUF4169 family protein [Alphaproteobacteria bacterium]
MPAEIINLKRVKKQKTRIEKDKAAAENRRKYGRTKDEKARSLLEEKRAQKNLDHKKLMKDDD